ncbi:MAG TPA: lipopolysaccharide heptosyltransferase II [Bryobacteraceae bacterium]|nr:lipopolysaccharide heptosyltransferase II [Bryobacteraceae bacterium]
MSFSNILVRATNWVGDAVMSLPALRAIRERFPSSRISIVAKPSVADLYSRERLADDVIPYLPVLWRQKVRFALDLRARKFDSAILLQNAFEAALMAFTAGIPTRIGYSKDGRGPLLTQAIPLPKKGEIPRHERFYYLEMLRRAGILTALPESSAIRLEGAAGAAEEGRARFREQRVDGPVLGLSPGAAYGTAKRWLPERFAESAVRIARARHAAVAVFGSRKERELCEEVRREIQRIGGEVDVRNFAGETTLAQFIEMAAACEVFLTNDSGSMHIASALGIPTVSIFGATDDEATGPTGPLSRVVREPVECSPCLLRNCPIDHRCMTRVSADIVTETALKLLQ